MKIDIENATSLPVRNVHYVTDQIIRFQLDGPPDPVDHFSRPTYLYTNCQAFVSIVALSNGSFEALFHPHGRGFRSRHYFGERDAAPEDALVLGSFEEAEAAAKERLSHVRILTLQLRKGATTETLYLQPAGERNEVETLFAQFRGEHFPVLLGGRRPGTHYEAFAVVNNLRPDGFVVEACATCEFFRFSGLTRDWFNGSAGYCQHPSVGTEPVHVSVFHYCSDYSFIEKRPC